MEDRYHCARCNVEHTKMEYVSNKGRCPTCGWLYYDLEQLDGIMFNEAILDENHKQLVGSSARFFFRIPQGRGITSMANRSDALIYHEGGVPQEEKDRILNLTGVHRDSGTYEVRTRPGIVVLDMGRCYKNHNHAKRPFNYYRHISWGTKVLWQFSDDGIVWVEEVSHFDFREY